MKILTAQQIKEADSFTMENEPIASIDLMERAAVALTGWVTDNFSPKTKIACCCGPGNNGGDGLALARLLKERYYTVTVFIVETEKKSSDFITNRARLESLNISVTTISDESTIPDWDDFDVVIDALFGSGLSGNAEGIFASVIRDINASDCTVIAIDMPSGVFSATTTTGEAIVRADVTLTFQVPKLALFLPENASYVGYWEILDIQLSQEFIAKASTNKFLLTFSTARTILRRREKFSHKGDFGRALILSGSYGKMGAAVLCGKAAMRSGLGLLTMCVPASGYSIIQTSLPESMAMTDESEEFITTCPDFDGMDALGIGPGLGTAQETLYALIESLRNYDKPAVLDADALNLLASHHELKEVLPANSVLTPHPKEFERLVGVWSDDFERLEKQVALAAELNCIIVLKGAHTSIALPDGNVYFNFTGNPGMATAGSGDVLTGIITGLMAQQYDPGDAALLGVYIHGLAGDLAAEELTEISMIAGDIIDYLPRAFSEVLDG
jgi:ADP-dependent NAD(P)H-hydrate dehydratase / NAD(P)H-hydrate epimerase